MAKNMQPIAKRCKALGISPTVMGYSKKETKRNPGGQMRKKKSEYAIQLNEKQKVKFVYGILEKQFHMYYEKASRMPGKTGENLLTLVERRLDNVVYRLGFAMTRREARQLVNHAHFTVNGQKRKFDGIRQGNTYIGSGVSSVLTASGEMDKPITLTLKPELLQVSMKPGEHTLTVIYGENNSGTGTVTFTVEIPANYLDVTNKPEFDGKTTVTVDGKESPIEEMGGERYVNLPETGDLLTIYSFKDGTPTGSYTNYPMGMQVFRITRQEGGAKAEEIPEFANLLNYCSIRISGKQGIRMITGIDQNVKKSLVSKAGLAGYTLEEYGTVVQWADQLGSNTLNLSSSNKQNYAYKKGKADPIFALENGMIQYTNVLVGFTDAQCQPDLVMRPYIKLIDTATGETVTLYGGSVTRSIGYVAWQNRDTYKQGTASYKYVWNIINSVNTSKYPN